jgi:hypothetical protein
MTEQNKSTEKHNQIFYEKLLATLNASNLSHTLWAEVLQAIVRFWFFEVYDCLFILIN